MSQRKIYFGAGPAALPEVVLQQMAEAVLDYKHSGISILSINHRGSAVTAILEEAKMLVLQLAALNADDYEVLFLQGGGRHQFAMAPMNFLSADRTAGYIDSGHWSADAMRAAAYYGKTMVLASSAGDGYRHLPAWPQAIPDDLAYLHLTTNNTIYGTQWPDIPVCPVPLIADMSSDIFSCARDYSKYSLIYAVAQKNIGPAGVTVVIIRKEMLGKPVRALPDVFNYTAQARANSVLNTPPVSAIYACLLMLRWIAGKGMSSVGEENKKKAALLYSEIDRNAHFEAPVARDSRSAMNVIFTIKNRKDEAAFLEYCAARNIEGIKGHRSVGGFRVSLYNAVGIEDVAALVSAMQMWTRTDQGNKINFKEIEKHG